MVLEIRIPSHPAGQPATSVRTTCQRESAGPILLLVCPPWICCPPCGAQFRAPWTLGSGGCGSSCSRCWGRMWSEVGIRGNHTSSILSSLWGTWSLLSWDPVSPCSVVVTPLRHWRNSFPYGHRSERPCRNEPLPIVGNAGKKCHQFHFFIVTPLGYELPTCNDATSYLAKLKGSILLHVSIIDLSGISMDPLPMLWSWRACSPAQMKCFQT